MSKEVKIGYWSKSVLGECTEIQLAIYERSSTSRAKQAAEIGQVDAAKMYEQVAALARLSRKKVVPGYTSDAIVSDVETIQSTDNLEIVYD